MKVFPPAINLGSCLTYFRTGQQIAIDHYDPHMAIAPQYAYTGTIEQIGLSQDAMLHIVIRAINDNDESELIVLRIATAKDGHTQTTKSILD